MLDLDPSLEIQAGFAFAVSELRLCQRAETAVPVAGGTCFNQFRIVTVNNIIIIIIRQSHSILLSHYKIHDI